MGHVPVPVLTGILPVTTSPLACSDTQFGYSDRQPALTRQSFWLSLQSRETVATADLRVPTASLTLARGTGQCADCRAGTTLMILSITMTKALVIVLWLVFLVTPIFFAFRADVRSVSIYPISISLVIGVMLARFGPYRTTLYSAKGIWRAGFLLICGILFLWSVALLGSTELISEAHQFWNWLSSSREIVSHRVASSFAWNYWVYCFLLLFALVEGLWFRGLWFAMFPTRPWLTIGIGSALSAGWHALVTYELVRVGYGGPGGLQLLAPMALAGVAFGIIRHRGGSWLAIALADGLLQCLLYVSYLGGSPIHFSSGATVALYLFAYLLLASALWCWRADGVQQRRTRFAFTVLYTAFALVVIAPVGWTIWHSPFRVRPARKDVWKNAIDYFAAELPKRHVDFDALMPRARFSSEVARLKAGAGKLSDDQIILELRGIVAQLRVAHSEVRWKFVLYPIHFAWLSDGVVVAIASREYQKAIGCRVLSFGPLAPEVTRARLAPYIPHENEAWLDTMLLSGEASNVSLLERIGVVSPSRCLELTLERRDKTVFTMDIWPAGPGFEWAPPDDALKLPNVTRNERTRNYEAQYHEDSKALCIKFRRCEEDPGYSFTAFEAALGLIVSQHSVERVIVDLRQNQGGTSKSVNSFMEILRRSRLFRKGTPPIVLIGGGTYSAAVITASFIRGEFGAVFIGGPTGGKPVFYANAKVFRLPHVDAEVAYATVKVALGHPDAPWLRPDVLVPVTVEDLLTGRDPAMEAAYNYSPLGN